MCGIETFVIMLARTQLREGRVHPSIAASLKSRKELMQLAQHEGIPFFELLSSHNSSFTIYRKIHSAYIRACRIIKISRLLRQSDILHMHPVAFGGINAFLSAILARPAGIIVTHHATIRWQEQIKSRRRASALAFQLEKYIKAQTIMPYSEASTEVCDRGIPASRVHTIPFCVDFHAFASRKSNSGRRSCFRIIMLARLVPGKGHLELLRAVASIRREQDDIELIFAGSGPLHNDIELEAKRLRLSHRLTLLGHKPNTIVPELLEQADALALPSYYLSETFPISILEAMAAGLPVIGSRWFGIPDIILDGVTGIIVEPKDVEGLAAAIETLASDPKKAEHMGRMGQKHARDHFSSDQISQIYESLYRQQIT